MAGPLAGIRVIEMAGIGPGPFACMLLSDMGAEVIRIDRISPSASANPGDIINRGRKSIAVDLKRPEGVATVLALIDTADILIEGFRPGVMEKLGLGPDVCHIRNSRLIYGRMTGWGQHGPLAQVAGHDINYIAVTGALDAIGRAQGGPVAPLNLLGDLGGGSLYLIMGILSAYISAQKTGKGQVVDCAITDGVISLMSFIQGFKSMGLWQTERQSNLLDGGAHFYDTYECADGRYIAIGAIEPQFYALLIEKTGLDFPVGDFMQQLDKNEWPQKKQQLTELFKTKTRAQWCELLEGTDACFGPVLDMDEAVNYPHNVERNNFVDIDGVIQSAPAPRFSVTQAAIQGPPVAAGSHSRELLDELGLDTDALIASGAVAVVQ